MRVDDITAPLEEARNFLVLSRLEANYLVKIVDTNPVPVTLDDAVQNQVLNYTLDSRAEKAVLVPHVARF